MSEKNFLDHAYGLTSVEDTRAFYADWSLSYDAELHRNGYVTPQRCAEALARHMPDKSGPVLDVGCGTGLSGMELRAAGFSPPRAIRRGRPSPTCRASALPAGRENSPEASHGDRRGARR